MANDRVFLRCRVCRRSLMIYKYYPSAGGAQDGNRIEQFINEHAEEKRCANHFGGSLDGDVLFELWAESGKPEHWNEMMALREKDADA